jgi:Rieske Fe-S protein
VSRAGNCLRYRQVFNTIPRVSAKNSRPSESRKMAEDQQKKTPPSPNTGSSSNTPVPAQTAAKPVQAKGPLLSRRAFLIGAVGASTLLTVAALSQSGGILGPLVPTPEPSIVIANANDLETQYQASATDVNSLTTSLSDYVLNGKPSFAQFFYWPYDISVSPYYKSIVVRLPDDKFLTNQPSTQQYLGQTFTSTPVSEPGSPTGARFVAFNTTCVHLRCLVNPGYGGDQFRLQCPCHGSQYNLTDGVPVQGPAFDLGLNPLPKVQLSIDSSGNITATNLVGQPGIGRTTQ